MSPKRILKFALIGAGALILFAIPPTLWLFFSYYNQLQDEVVARFSGKRWNIPSRIYSDSVLIYPGQDLKDLGFFERLARLNYHPVDPGHVASRGEYSFDRKRGKLDIFLHSFAYPYGNFGGEFVDLTLKGDTIESMGDPVTHKPIFSIELEPELISGIFEGEWEQRR
ncbi:MAG: hypothetical protein WCE23_17880, partial [Candidatus Binatus sp.]|uniref:hypothetical protein n=1 Tax=Candidatus Binatus sp. TaxID=2811406 RepID=UPI003C738E03